MEAVAIGKMNLLFGKLVALARSTLSRLTVTSESLDLTVLAINAIPASMWATLVLIEG